MNEKNINELVGAVDLDESLLGSVVGGQCPPSTTTSSGCPSYTTRPIQCGGTTINDSCTPPGTFCP